MLSHPRSHFLYVVAWLGVWSLCWFALLLVGILLVFCFHSAVLLAIALCIFFINIFVFLPLVFSFRCPHCDGFGQCRAGGRFSPLETGFSRVGFASWVAVVFDIVLHHDFTCMHCAERCLVKVNTNSANSLARHDDRLTYVLMKSIVEDRRGFGREKGMCVTGWVVSLSPCVFAWRLGASFASVASVIS